MQGIPTREQSTPAPQQPMYPMPQRSQKPQRSRRRLWLFLGIGVAVILVLGIIGSVIGTQGQTPTTLLPTPPVQQSTTQPLPTQTTTEAPQPTPTPAKPTPIPTIAPISLSGVGQQASQKFQLQEGLAIFKLTHDGTSNFIVHILDSNGKVVDYLVNEIGSFDGSAAVGIQSAGTYLLDIQADGKWTVTIQQPRPTTAPFTTSFSGTGRTVTQLFSIQSGLKIIKLTHDGTSNFIVHILDSNGNVVDYLVNVIGKFDGTKAEGIPEDGIYLFDVQADGNWTITIQ